MSKDSICIDFDGVIHGYTNGWLDGSIYDPPIEGSKEFLDQMKKDGYYIIINTSRVLNGDNTINKEQYDDLVVWLKKYEIPYDEIFGKPIAVAYIDDRAIEYDNNDKSKDWKYVVKRVNDLMKPKEHVKDSKISLKVKKDK